MTGRDGVTGSQESREAPLSCSMPWNRQHSWGASDKGSENTGFRCCGFGQ